MMAGQVDKQVFKEPDALEPWCSQILVCSGWQKVGQRRKEVRYSVSVV